MTEENKVEKVKIGIPQALLYHKYFELWQAFLSELGAEVVLSPETNKKILEKGANLAVDESCLSLKIFLGHVDWLKDKADFIFVPHIASLKKREEICVKLMGLPDICGNTFPKTKFLDYTVDIRRYRPEILGFLRLGWNFSKNPFLIMNAYIKAKNSHRKKKHELIDDQKNKIKTRDQ